MTVTLKTKLIVSFVVIVIIFGLIATLIGVRLIGNGIVRQAQEKVKLDLNSAREVYNHKRSDIEHVVSFTSVRDGLKDVLSQKTVERKEGEKEVPYDSDWINTDGFLLGLLLFEVREKAHLDFLTVTDETGRVVFRTSNPEMFGDSQAADELVSSVLSDRKALSATQIVSQEQLLLEGEELAARAKIPLIHTLNARPEMKEEETSGMVLKAAAPIVNDRGELIGVLYGGNLLNRDAELVDDIKNIVYQDAMYKGKHEGAATIFMGNLRIATNVMDQQNERAIGTQLSAEVQAQVLDRGKPWMDRAFVVNDWYITAYEPIRNISGDVVGILNVAMLEERFSDMERNGIFIFLGITMTGAMFSLLIAYFLATDFLKPIGLLVRASHELSKGNFAYRIEPVSKNELGKLEGTFNFMAAALKERDDEMKEETQRQLFQSAKLASVGRLAAGVAHQINNPLTGVLTYSSLLLKKNTLDDQVRQDLEVIVNETMRCREIVKGLLGFSKQSELRKEATAINTILRSALALTKNQAMLNNVTLITTLHDPLPSLVVDGNQLQEVFLNIILNAIDAMPDGGELHVKSAMTENNCSVRMTFADTGCGISEENISKVFDPFFTTKDESKGTGLGLAVAYGIIEKHQGKIWVESEVDNGTTCLIDLPVNG